MTLHLDPRKTALVLIDLQAGVMAMPMTPHTAARVVENAAALGRRFETAGAPIVLVNANFATDYADRLAQPVDAPMSSLPPGGIPAGWAVLVPEIGALRAAVTITKRQWGAYHGTELDLQLRRRGVDTIVLGGVATNFGVESTAREAWQHNYGVIVAEDACSGIGDDLHQFSIGKILPRIARVRSTAEIAAALSGEGENAGFGSKLSAS